MKVEKENADGEISFMTLASENVPFEANNFIEVALKRVELNDFEPNADGKRGSGREFVCISCGFFTTGEYRQKRYKRSITMPADKATVKKVADALNMIFDERKDAFGD